MATLQPLSPQPLSSKKSSEPRQPSSADSPQPAGRLRELAVLAVAGAVYFGGRVIVEGGTEESTTNAQRLIDFEQSIGIDIEQSVQQLAIESDVIRTLGNLSYVWLHWPLLLTILWLLFRMDRRRYLQLRNALFASGLCGLVLFTIYPMAPPRFMPGFVGTVSDEARRHYLTYPLSWTNRFAAFPSFHVGWTLIACVALATSLHHERLRWLALVPAAMVCFAVVSTANHFLIDAVVGGLIAVGAYIAAGRMQREQISAR